MTTKEVNILNGAVGLITDTIQTEEILQAGKADLIYIYIYIERESYKIIS